jgi:hypothetical protein
MNQEGKTTAAGIDLDSPLIAALKSARELLANLDGLSKNNICNLAAEEVEQIDASLARRAAEAAPAADERTLLERAIDSTYPIPDSPHNSVVQRAVDNRIAFRFGWEKCRAALAQKSSHSTAAVVAADVDEHLNVIAEMAKVHTCGVTQNALEKVRAALATHAGLSQFANGEDAGQPAQVVVPDLCPACDMPSDAFSNCGAPNCAVRGYGPGDASARRQQPVAVAPSDATGKATELPKPWRDAFRGTYPNLPVNEIRASDALTWAESEIKALRMFVDATGKADADELAFNATRLRNVARLVGLESAVPQDDATLDGARGSVLGLIAGKLRTAGAAGKADAANAGEPKRMSITESKEYLIAFMERYFKDKTFHSYIRGGYDAGLAGDFAWEMARALRMLESSQSPATSAADAMDAERLEAIAAQLDAKSGEAETWRENENNELLERIRLGARDGYKDAARIVRAAMAASRKDGAT